MKTLEFVIARQVYISLLKTLLRLMPTWAAKQSRDSAEIRNVTTYRVRLQFIMSEKLKAFLIGNHWWLVGSDMIDPEFLDSAFLIGVRWFG